MDYDIGTFSDVLLFFSETVSKTFHDDCNEAAFLKSYCTEKQSKKKIVQKQYKSAENNINFKNIVEKNNQDLSKLYKFFIFIFMYLSQGYFIKCVICIISGP